VKVLADHAQHLADIKIYSHSPLLYWWPVWFVAFLAASWTYLDNYHLALVPEKTAVQGNRLIAPEGSELSVPVEHVARSPIPGAVFVLTLLLTIVFSNAGLRGPWAVILGLCLVTLLLLVAWLGWWTPLIHWFGLMRVHMNLGGYLTLAIPLLLVWAVTFFVFDRRTYILFSAGQIRICDKLGQSEKVFDAWSVGFEKQPYDWFRRQVGWGAGDLVLRAGGAIYELPNVVSVARRLKQIEQRLQTREVE
jgi:hypothetical protein